VYKNVVATGLPGPAGPPRGLTQTAFSFLGRATFTPTCMRPLIKYAIKYAKYASNMQVLMIWLYIACNIMQNMQKKYALFAKYVKLNIDMQNTHSPLCS
jgi:hypothetical protein